MPIFLDRHELNETISAEAVAQKHLNDMRVQHKFNCRKLGYCFDEEKGIAYCLFEADEVKCVTEMHKHAHDNVPNQIFEVNADWVESFWTQAIAPGKKTNVALVDYGANSLTTIMATSLDIGELFFRSTQSIKHVLKKYHKLIDDFAIQFGGKIVSTNGENFVVFFKSAAFAIKCALKIDKEFLVYKKKTSCSSDIKIGLSGKNNYGVQPGAYDSSIKIARQLCYMSRGKILVTLNVNNLFQDKKLRLSIQGKRVKSISQDDVKFISDLFRYFEGRWKDSDFHVDEFVQHLGHSKSQVYRKMISLWGASPNNFVKEYRLMHAMELLKTQNWNIAEIAFEAGFSSPSYFSKCFLKRYGITPSEYLQITSPINH